MTVFAYILQSNYGIEMPRWLQIRFSQDVQKMAEGLERELSVEEIWKLFQEIYMANAEPLVLKKFSLSKEELGDTVIAEILDNNDARTIEGQAFGT